MKVLRESRTGGSGYSRRIPFEHWVIRLSQFIYCQLMVICRLARPIQNPPHPTTPTRLHSPPTVLVLDGSQSSAAAIPHPSLSLRLLLLLWRLCPLPRRLVWQPFRARKHTAPLGFFLSPRAPTPSPTSDDTREHGVSAGRQLCSS